jgi:hypothetical protein
MNRKISVAPLVLLDKPAKISTVADGSPEFDECLMRNW